MLHTETVAGPTLGLLKKLEAENAMSDFNLAGGTSLALYLGHRISVDLDLFTQKPFDAKKMEEYLASKYGFRTDFMEKNTLKGTIDGVKIDCITHSYDYLEKPYTESGIRLYSMEDIIAMKLSAIADNGSRLKDFIDIAFLSTRFSFGSMLRLYERKFPGSNLIRPFKAITYFDDIDFEEDIVMLNCKFDWKLIERRLADMTKIQNKVFESFPLPLKEQESRSAVKKGIHKRGLKR
ncbi:nucleotidyl transferase AbiEii/AbiGii toxin family protein [Bacteroides intestinalis]|uniref:nucleotidyl transferase AbiEii/AbiGii toxin family protein n=1 Tax=Bacteroides intestinalis TaxID=329854 RepID=UPI00189C8B1A|nr:nucleotidyl transferase AbiEii/AbiGii toxin family protein [Bacteroides intestinalis]